MRKCSILAYQGHEVGDRRERNHVEQPFLPSVGNRSETRNAAFLSFRERRLDELERHRRAAEITERILTKFGINDRNGIRQCAGLLMMVRYDNINAFLLCKIYRLGSVRPEIDRDYE